ncbi:MAG TPA: CCA tRNA nucleotidyltransferase [Acidimicrobiia bacterium]|nr:CCA tRNA nucleotidyltransferase [Acidimicrobiia bacterium]
MTAVPPRLARYFEPTSATQQLSRRLNDAGHSAYLVGGSVRDAFLDRLREDSDTDIATDARPDVIERVVKGWADSVWLQGERFGTVGCEKNGEVFEITTFRAEIYRVDSRKPEVSFSDDIETDLSRRDFTINAIAIALDEPDLVDPYSGLDDLVARRLRTPLSPEISFGDDPLRMLRAARFVATLGFEPDAELLEAVEQMRERLQIISAERIRDELSKLLLADDPSAGLWLISRTRLSDEFLPELNSMQLEQDPIHTHKDVLAHSIAVVAKTSPRLKLRLAALLHDVGKPGTRGFGPQGVTFHYHDVVGARMARQRLLALRYPNEIVDDVAKLVELHLRFHTYRMGWTDSAVRRYVRDAGHLLDDLNELTRSDCTTRNAKKAAALSRRMDQLEERIAELREQEELAKLRPALDGDEIMRVLGVKPGRVVGEAKAFLMEIRLDEGEISPEEARERLLAWASEQGVGS